MKDEKEIIKRVKKLCDVLEIDHIGLITEGTRRLMDQHNEIYNRKSSKIDCNECAFNDNECGWARCPTKDEWEVIKAHFKKIYKIEELIDDIKTFSFIDNFEKKWAGFLESRH